MAAGADEDVAALVPEGFARVLQQVHEGVQQMAALHEQGRKLAAIIPVDPDRVSRRRRKHLGDGVIQFLNHVQLLHVAFAQLRVAHDLRDDPVGVLDFLLDDSDLLGRDRLALLERALQREGGVVDNGERVFDLMRELGRHTPGGAQLAFPHRELARFFHRPPLPLQQDLHAVAADRHQQQQRQAQRQRLGEIIRRAVRPRFSRAGSSGLSGGETGVRGRDSAMPASPGLPKACGWPVRPGHVRVTRRGSDSRH